MKNKMLVFIAGVIMILMSVRTSLSQNVTISDMEGYTAQPSAMLDVNSPLKGFLVPRLAKSQRDMIPDPVQGLLVFNLTDNCFSYYTGIEKGWVNLTMTEVNGGAVPYNQSIFCVRNSLGDTVFAVYPEGVRITVGNGIAKGSGNKGGFAVGGFSGGKTTYNEFLKVFQDSVRIYVNENVKGSGNKGGFAVGGFSGGKAINEFMHITPKNYFIGHEAGVSTLTGEYNSFIGYKSGRSNNTGNRNLFMGYYAGYSNLSGNNNIFIGDSTGYSNNNGRDNVCIGNFAGLMNYNGAENIFMGVSAGRSNYGGICNVFIGNDAGYKHTSGNYNTFIGAAAGYELNSSYNTFMGTNSARFINSGSSNVFIGVNSGYRLGKGSQNTFIGSDCGRGGDDGYVPNPADPESAYGNTFLGFYAGGSIYNGDYNLLLGNYAGLALNSGSRNVALGYSAGQNISSGTNNVFIGYQAGNGFNTGTGNICIGYQAGLSGGGSNQLYIDNSNNPNPLIYGDFNSDILRFNGSVGIGKTPGTALDVNGTVTATAFSGPLSGNVTGNVSGNVTGNVTGNLTGNVNNVSIGRIFMTSSGTIISTRNGNAVLSWNGTTDISITNTSGDYIDYWCISQKGASTNGSSGAINNPNPTTTTIITGVNTNDYGFEIHFGQADGEDGWCSVWLQYANGYLVGHYIKY